MVQLHAFCVFDDKRACSTVFGRPLEEAWYIHVNGTGADGWSNGRVVWARAFVQIC